MCHSRIVLFLLYLSYCELVPNPVLMRSSRCDGILASVERRSGDKFYFFFLYILSLGDKEAPCKCVRLSVYLESEARFPTSPTLPICVCR